MLFVVRVLFFVVEGLWLAMHGSVVVPAVV